jgi:hypothetical protein
MKYLTPCVYCKIFPFEFYITTLPELAKHRRLVLSCYCGAKYLSIKKTV